MRNGVGSAHETPRKGRQIVGHHFATGHTWHGKSAKKKIDKVASSNLSMPWAIAGIAAAFGGGAILGMLGGKKMAVARDGEGGGGHHHHGFGDPGCRMRHTDQEPAAPGATDEKRGERDEGE
jgi:hypothetical protein